MHDEDFKAIGRFVYENREIILSALSEKNRLERELEDQDLRYNEALWRLAALTGEPLEVVGYTYRLPDLPDTEEG
ncbi:hypothetical protein AB0I72_26680 [Nocardiopsis sp. NPDC049922]|uniref:hypothetical protein n=1 Tax=Nocardiopsis sp. NPDC049922 TaxID=3155157 RepID=UPI0033DC2B2C